MIGQRVWVPYARMAGEVTGEEHPWPAEPESVLYEVTLDDGRLCYATASQLGTE